MTTPFATGSPEPQEPMTRAELADAIWEGRLSPAEAAQIDPRLAELIPLAGMSSEEAQRRIDLSAYYPADEDTDEDDEDGWNAW